MTGREPEPEEALVARDNPPKREPEPSYEHDMVRIPDPEMASERDPEPERHRRPSPPSGPEPRAAETADEHAGVGEGETDG